MREKKKLTQGDIAKMLKVSRSTYANYEKEQSEPPASQLLKIAQFYNVSTDDLLTKDIGAPLFRQKAEKTDNILSNDVRVLHLTVDKHQKENIQLVPAKAIAGYVEGRREEEYILELPRFFIPKLPEGTYRAFEIQGDSMPPIQDGYIVVGRFVAHARDLKSGQRYIVVLRDNNVVFKKVISELDKNKKLLLASDNSDFLPYSIEARDVLEAWEFVAFIGFPNKIDINYALLDKLHDIQQQIAQLASEIR